MEGPHLVPDGCSHLYLPAMLAESFNKIYISCIYVCKAMDIEIIIID